MERRSSRACASPTRECEIAVVGKYTHLRDAYKSIVEAFVHAGAANHARVRAPLGRAPRTSRRGRRPSCWTDVDGVLVPGGFGERGIEGKIAAVRFARERGVPFFGICLGMQVADHRVRPQRLRLGGGQLERVRPDDAAPGHRPDGRAGRHHRARAARCGSAPTDCALREGSLAARPTARAEIDERHRHRYEFNNAYRAQLQSRGLVLSGRCVGRDLVEIVELPDHPWFVAVQFHPEFKSRPHEPHPLFRDFVRAALERRRARAAATRSTPAEERADHAPETAGGARSEPLLHRRRRGRRPGPARHRRAVRDRERGACASRSPRALQGAVRRARAALRLQGLVPQGQPLERSAPSPGSASTRRSAMLARVRRETRRAGADRRARGGRGARPRPRWPTCCRSRRSSAARPRCSRRRRAAAAR